VFDSWGYPARLLPLLYPGAQKGSWYVPRGFQTAPLPLQCIYVLTTGTGHEIAPLRPQEAVIEVVRHSYPTRFLQPGGAAHLHQCARLAGEVPIRRFCRANDVSALLDLVELVEADLARDVEDKSR
jgi:hypothetical protein